MVPLGYAIANPTYKNYESQGGFGLILIFDVVNKHIFLSTARKIRVFSLRRQALSV